MQKSVVTAQMPPPPDRAPLTQSDAPSTHSAGENAPTSKEARLPGHELTNEDVAWDLFGSFEEGIERTPSIYVFSPEKIFTGIVEPSADDAVCQWQVSDRSRLGNCIAKAFRLPPDYIENITSTAIPWMLNSGERQLRWVLNLAGSSTWAPAGSESNAISNTNSSTVTPSSVARRGATTENAASCMR